MSEWEVTEVGGEGKGSTCRQQKKWRLKAKYVDEMQPGVVGGDEAQGITKRSGRCSRKRGGINGCSVLEHRITVQIHIRTYVCSMNAILGL